MNTKQKGNFGIGCAIKYFTQLNYTVSIPITDSQDYDLIVDNKEKLLKVQVKYTSATQNGHYKVYLRSISGSSRKCYKTVKETSVDLLFIVTEKGDCYLFNIEDVTQSSGICLNLDKDKYKVS